MFSDAFGSRALGVPGLNVDTDGGLDAGLDTDVDGPASVGAEGVLVADRKTDVDEGGFEVEYGMGRAGRPFIAGIGVEWEEET